jgi:hypothetical protein
VLAHVRPILYLTASGLVWFAEDYLFTRGLRFNAAQTVVVTVYFVALFGAAVRFILLAYARADKGVPSGSNDISPDRLVAMAPVFTLIVGSFAALPMLMLVLVLGAVL